MNASTVISVNPSLSTPGTLHRVASGAIPRRHIIGKKGNALRRGIDRLLGLGKISVNAKAMRLAAFRMLFAAFMIACILTDSFPADSAVDIILGVGAAMLFMGLLQRPAMTLTAVTAGWVAMTAAMQGIFDSTMALTAIVSVMLAVSGPGRYSADALIGRSYYRAVSRRRQRRDAEALMSYKAYSHTIYR